MKIKDVTGLGQKTKISGVYIHISFHKTGIARDITSRQDITSNHFFLAQLKLRDRNAKQIAEKIKSEFNEKLKGKIVTNISKEKLYQPAEDYHQYYLKKKGIL